jgi:hypothetical protein
MICKIHSLPPHYLVLVEKIIKDTNGADVSVAKFMKKVFLISNIRECFRLNPKFLIKL